MENINYYNNKMKYMENFGTRINKRDIENIIIYNCKKYILVKNFDGFYNKCLMYQNTENSNNYILKSYNTIVAEYNGEFMKIFGYYSKTTSNHINAFLHYFGFNLMSKKEIEECVSNEKNIIYK